MARKDENLSPDAPEMQLKQLKESQKAFKKEQKNQQSSYEVSKNYLQPICEPRGVLLGAISKRFDTIVEFTAFEDFISFERKGKNKVKRVENNKIKVTIEVDMVCGAVKF